MTLSDSDLRGGRGGVTGRIGALIDVLTKTGVVLGGAFAGWQYWEAKIDKRVERTMEYIVRYEDGRVGDARRRIDAGLRAHLAEFQEIAAGGISEADRDAMVLTIVDESSGADRFTIADDIDLIVDFFDGLRACTSKHLCEPSVAEEYFAASDVGVLFTNFHPYFEARRANNPRFGAALEEFAAGR